MTDREKIDLVKEFISNFYEMIPGVEGDMRCGYLEAVTDCAWIVLSKDPPEESCEKNSCVIHGGECRNCLE